MADATLGAPVRMASELAVKAFELARRQTGFAQEMLAARRLQPPRSSPDGVRVTVLTPRDWAAHVQWEALLARALAARGARVRVVTCGGGLELCDRVNTYEGPPLPCHRCSTYCTKAIGAHGFEFDRLIDLAGPEPWPEIDGLGMDRLPAVSDERGLPLGALVSIPLRWFLCRSNLESEPIAPLTYRRLLRSARQIASAFDRHCERHDPDVVLLLNGSLLFESIAAAVARRRGARVVSYERGFVHGTLVFAHGPDANRYEVGDAWHAARRRALTAEEEVRLDEYLDDRRHGRRALFDYWPGSQHEFERRGTSSVVTIFTNVTWDTATLGLESSHPTMNAWLVDCIEHLGDRANVEVVVRVHPGEARIPGWRTRESAEDVVRGSFPTLPANVRLIGPEDPTSSYDLMRQTNVGLVFSSTVGLEMALAGIPVVTAARTHYTGKGFTTDAHSPAELRAAIDQHLADDQPSVDVEAARRYANLLFFDAAYSLPGVVEPIPGLARLDPSVAPLLEPGAHRDVDRVCDAILTGVPFIGASSPSI